MIKKFFIVVGIRFDSDESHMEELKTIGAKIDTEMSAIIENEHYTHIVDHCFSNCRKGRDWSGDVDLGGGIGAVDVYVPSLIYFDIEVNDDREENCGECDDYDEFYSALVHPEMQMLFEKIKKYIIANVEKVECDRICHYDDDTDTETYEDRYYIEYHMD